MDRYGITTEEFNHLRLKKAVNLNDREVKVLKAIREAIPKWDNNTYFQKVLSAEKIPKYLGEDGYSTIQGFIARYDEPVGKRDFSEGGDSYGYIKFKTDHVERLSNLSGRKTDDADTGETPCILKGFTEVKNGEKASGYFVSGDKCLRPIDGAELHEVVNGMDTVIALFRDGHFRKNHFGELDGETWESTGRVRFGNYGQYHGNEYHVTREDGKEKLKIYTHDKSKTDESFVLCSQPGEKPCYKKYVRASELKKTYQVKNYVVNWGDGEKRMIVLKESEDRYLVSASGRDTDLIAQYQLKETERGIFQGWVSRKDVQLIENCKEVYYLD